MEYKYHFHIYETKLWFIPCYVMFCIRKEDPIELYADNTPYMEVGEPETIIWLRLYFRNPESRFKEIVEKLKKKGVF